MLRNFHLEHTIFTVIISSGYMRFRETEQNIMFLPIQFPPTVDDIRRGEVYKAGKSNGKKQ